MGLDAGARAEVHRALLERHGLPVRAPGVDPEAVLAAMRHDKKRVCRRRIGSCCWRRSGRPVYGVAVPAALVAEAVGRATSERASA